MQAAYNSCFGSHMLPAAHQILSNIGNEHIHAYVFMSIHTSYVHVCVVLLHVAVLVLEWYMICTANTGQVVHRQLGRTSCQPHVTVSCVPVIKV